IINGISYLKSSRYRLNIVLLLQGNIMTPAELQRKLNIRINHVSLYLRELKDKDIVVCLNEESKKGRLYQLTELGNELCSYLS
ncbi:MAG TPA: hypothetical protein O0W90_03885, partial [Methanocorpusculum sp.]|nr:hypothetical protein [Methanocorpusculum sp.]